jgi:SAM-dependent methyltransferase
MSVPRNPYALPDGVSPRLAHFTAGLPWERGPILAFMREVAAELSPGTRLLDIGAGDSPYRELFDHVEYVTTDWANSVHPGARTVDVVAPAHDLPIESGSFDAAVLTQVLEHVPDPGAVLAEANRILRDGGRLHLTLPLAWELHELPFDFYRYTAWGLHHLLGEAGFGEVDIRPRNDAFSTLAQLLADMGSTIGTYPDGRDGGRAHALARLRAMAAEVASYAELDARWVFPLGYRVTAIKGAAAPVVRRAREHGIEGARGFATLAFAEELVFDPSLLAAYAERFSGSDDATLVIYAPGVDLGELEARLGALVGELALDGDDAADLLALPLERDPEVEAGLAERVDAVLARRPPAGAFRTLPHFHDGTLDDLRALAGTPAPVTPLA